MHRFTIKAYVTIIMIVAIGMGGCSHTTNTATTVTAPPQQPVTDDQYGREIAKLDELVQKKGTSSAAREAHLKLAHLYSDHKNRHRNYQKALGHLQTYIRMDKSKVNEETLDWLASLEEIDRLTKEVSSQNTRISKMQKKLKQSNQEKSALTRTNHKLQREEISLRDKTRRLEESNLKLKKTIEMLKNLDQRLEEKRRNFNSRK